MQRVDVGGASELPDNIVPVIFAILQSNSNGRGEADRLAITTWPLRLVNCYYYVKTDYLSTDNGSFRSMWIGGPNFEEPNDSARRLFGGDAILACKMRALFGKDTPIYLINAAEGGTGTVADAGYRDWQQASNECFDRAINGMYLPAIADIEAAHPTKTIKVIVMYHGGETEAQEGAGSGKVANFPAALGALYNSINAVDNYLGAAPWLFTKLHYSLDAGEDAVNAHIQTFVNNNSARCKLIDISDQPRKIDLTIEQKAGVAPTGTDDNHTSYLGQIAKGERGYTQALNFFNWPNNDISDITNNTEFDPSVYVQPGKTAFRLQMNRGNMTVNGSGGTPGDENKITDVLDSLGLHNFTVGGTAGRLKSQFRKGCMYFPIGTTIGDTRIVSPVALTNSIFNDGGFVWSIGGWVKFAPNTGGTSPDQAILHTTDAYSGTRSNVLVYKTAAEKLEVQVRCASSTAKIATTASVIFEGAVNEGDQHFIHWCVTSNGSNLKIFINGVEVDRSTTDRGINV